MPAPVDLVEDGVLFMINVQVFHPLGYALAVAKDGSFQLYGDGSDRWVFSEAGKESADNDSKWAAFRALLRKAESGGHQVAEREDEDQRDEV